MALDEFGGREKFTRFRNVTPRNWNLQRTNEGKFESILSFTASSSTFKQRFSHRVTSGTAKIPFENASGNTEKLFSPPSSSTEL